jgi:hypothetical protein
VWNDTKKKNQYIGMSGFRITPDISVLKRVANTFLRDIDLDHVQEIHISRTKEAEIVSTMTDLYPELQIYYYPSKLYGLMEFNPATGDPHITMGTCIRILRQCMRASGRKVITKKIIRGSITETIIIIYPKSVVVDDAPLTETISESSASPTNDQDIDDPSPENIPVPQKNKRISTGMYVKIT